VSGFPAQILDAIEPFVASTPKPVHRFALAAVASPGGADAAEVVAALVEAGGRRRLAAGGEEVVLFDGPATAVRAGVAVLGGGAEAGIGLAISDVAVDGGPVSGPGVELAVLLGADAPPGEVVATATAGVLLAGSGITLEDLDAPHPRTAGHRALRVTGPARH